MNPQRTTSACSPAPINDASGSVLLLTLVVSLFLLTLGLAALWMTSTSTNIAANLTRRQEALAGAEAALERARGVLRTAGNWDTLLGSLSGVGCTSTPFNASKGNVLCDTSTTPPTPLENVPLVPDASQTKTVGQVPATDHLLYTLYIRNDPIETAGGVGVTGSQFNDDDRRVVVRAEASGRSGQGFAAVEATMILGAPGGGGILDHYQANITSTGANSADTTIAE